MTSSILATLQRNESSLSHIVNRRTSADVPQDSLDSLSSDHSAFISEFHSAYGSVVNALLIGTQKIMKIAESTHFFKEEEEDSSESTKEEDEGGEEDGEGEEAKEGEDDDDDEWEDDVDIDAMEKYYVTVENSLFGNSDISSKWRKLHHLCFSSLEKTGNPHLCSWISDQYVSQNPSSLFLFLFLFSSFLIGFCVCLSFYETPFIFFTDLGLFFSRLQAVPPLPSPPPVHFLLHRLSL
jgi:hypothetical protein